MNTTTKAATTANQAKTSNKPDCHNDHNRNQAAPFQPQPLVPPSGKQKAIINKL
jgi:hypothetical protein